MSIINIFLLIKDILKMTIFIVMNYNKCYNKDTPLQILIDRTD